MVKLTRGLGGYEGVCGGVSAADRGRRRCEGGRQWKVANNWAWPGLFIAQDEQDKEKNKGMSLPRACGRDPVAAVALPWAASEMASRAARGAAWRGLKASAEAALKAVGT